MLQEILKEQKETHRLNNQLVSKIERLAYELENFKKEFNTNRNVDVIDNSKALEIIEEKIENIEQVMATQQKNIAHEKRIMILPEFKSPECYRLLFNCIIYLTIATYGFLIIKLVVDHWSK